MSALGSSLHRCLLRFIISTAPYSRRETVRDRYSVVRLPFILLQQECEVFENSKKKKRRRRGKRRKEKKKEEENKVNEGGEEDLPPLSVVHLDVAVLVPLLPRATHNQTCL